MCLDSERQALLEFKHGIVYDKYGILSSWDDDNNNISKDCCSWWGVKCNNTTAHVVSLDLHGEDSWLAGEVSFSALIKLEHLRYLDLSFNNFSESQMGGEAIGSFHRLNHLNLSFNAFSGAIPHQLGNLSNLQSLHLGSNAFTGEVPRQLGNLSSSLQTLDLGGNSNLTTNNLVWLSQLYLLRQLDLSSMNLENITNWEQVVTFNLPFLEELYLQRCGLLSSDVTPSSMPPLLLTNSTSNSLSILDLSWNQLTSFPHWLFNMSSNKLVSIHLFVNDLEGPIPDDAFGKMFSLQDIDMRFNHLTGEIPKSFQNLSHLRLLYLRENNLSEPFPEFLQKLSKGAEISLELLDLFGNQFYGPFTGITRFASLSQLSLGKNRFNGSLMSGLVLPPSLEVLDLSNNQIAGNILIDCFPHDLAQHPNSLSLSSSLTTLVLSNNRFKGNLPVNIGVFSKLQYLDVSSNLLDGTISQLHLSNLSNLNKLVLSFNSLSFNESLKWMPPFQLESLELRNCTTGPHFPQWLRSQTNLQKLDLSSNGISETIPSWFWNSITLRLGYLNLSHNQISGSLPHLSLYFHGFPVIDLSHNNFSGPILSVPRNLSTLFLNTNKFMGAISFLCALNGQHLESLDLSDNLFSGDIPNCWMNKTSIRVIDLSNNGLSGSIPNSLGSLDKVVAINLRNNYFVGEIPPSMTNCGNLQLLDVGGNKLTGTIPSWIGMSLTSLEFLSLRSNNFNGSIPHNICHLSRIQVLDLSQNKLSQEIPNCFISFTFLVQKGTPSNMTIFPTRQYTDLNKYYPSPDFYMYVMWVQWKRSYLQYDKILGQLKVIDFSDNMLDGEIPKEIASLSELVSLNLSFNNLTGNIISHIDHMKMLEVLDLSRNHLSGEIPAGLAQLTFLDVLNFSYNNLSGRIPSSTQLQTSDPSAYTGNNGLCGLPLNKCPGDDNDSRPPTTDHGKDDNVADGDGFMSKEEYMVMGLGFLFGLLGVLVVLCKASWRNAYFRLLEDSYDWLYVRTMVYWLRLKRKFE